MRTSYSLAATLMACLAVTSVPAAARAQDSTKPKPVSIPKYRFRLMGVYDAQTGQPVEGAQVVDVLNGNSSLTTSTGTVSLIFLPEGGSLVRVKKLGYEMQSFLVSISPADTTPITLLMDRATDLAPVVATADSSPQYKSPSLRGFEERRKEGMGHFIAESELRKNDDRRMAEVLQGKIPGIIVETTSRGLVVHNVRDTGMGQRGGNLCTVRIYVDGVPAAGDVNQDVTLYAGVEYYTGAEVPPQYNGSRPGGACNAVLLLWTRER